MRAVSDGEAVTGLWFADQEKLFVPGAREAEPGRLPVFEALGAWLELYFAGRDPGPIPPVRTAGTPFQEEVWAMLRQIPWGRTVTYKGLAEGLGRRMVCQAVGGAVGRNPVAVLIPCHRVVGADGSLTGYAGGLWRKEALLKLEKEK